MSFQAQQQIQQPRVVALLVTEEHLELLTDILQRRNASQVKKFIKARTKSGRTEPMKVDNYIDVSREVKDGVERYYITTLNPLDARYQDATPKKPSIPSYSGDFFRDVSVSVASNFQQMHISSSEAPAPQFQQVTQSFPASSVPSPFST